MIAQSFTVSVALIDFEWDALVEWSLHLLSFKYWRKEKGEGRKKQWQEWDLPSRHKNTFKHTFCCSTVCFKKCHDCNWTDFFKKNVSVRIVLLISTRIHLSLKIADIPVQVLYNTNGTNAETNYVLFPWSKMRDRSSPAVHHGVHPKYFLCAKEMCLRATRTI